MVILAPIRAFHDIPLRSFVPVERRGSLGRGTQGTLGGWFRLHVCVETLVFRLS